MVRTSVFDGEESVAIRERPLCQARRASARCAGVVRSPVVRSARSAERDCVLDVVLIEARCGGVRTCRRGALMPAAIERHSPAAQPAHAPDRFAREIVALLNVRFGRP